jgi:amino acid adenylation domain-containing protein
MKCIHDLFEEHAERNPGADAVLFKDTKLTYGQLNRRATDLAKTLRALGVGPDVLVAVFLDRTPEMIVALLGVLKAGGAYVPLDPAHPQRRLAYLLTDARPLVVLTQRDRESNLPLHDAHVVLIDSDLMTPSSPLTGVSRSSSDSRNLAYVIYTSGSTGDPKGVEIEHHSVVNMLTAMRRRPGFAAEDRMLAITTLAFDIAALEIFLPLTTGACVVVAPRDVAADGVALSRLIQQSGVTVIQATPATMRMLLDAGWSGAPNLKVFCGGEAWTDQLAERLLECCGSLWNMYGPTETTVWSSVAKIEKGRPVVLGPPIANTRLYVLDHAAQLVPIGVPGELYIGGEGLARGYLRRDQLTRERFVSDPYASARGARMYRTGDQVRRLAGGALEFLGRLDHQVKIRGYRVELGEIEARMTEHAAVREAAAISREDSPGDKRIVAYFTGEADRVAELRAYLADALPEYMVPAAYVCLDSMPLTPNGKLDRAALPLPGAAAFAAREREAPIGPIETAIKVIWAEFLGLDRIGRHDSFFELGGHSLMALHVIGRINNTFGAHLRVPMFFRDPTLSALARVLDGEHRDTSEPRIVLLREGKPGSRSPLYFIGAGPTEHRLAALIGDDRPVYAVDLSLPVEWARAVDERNSAALPTMNRLGALYAEVLRRHVGSSPCLIVGYSLFGKIAFEAASELLRAGGNVVLLLLIDAQAFVRDGAIRGAWWHSLQWIWRDGSVGLNGDGAPGDRLLDSLRVSLRLLCWLVVRVLGEIRGRLTRQDRFRRADRLSGFFDNQGVPIKQSTVNRLAAMAGKEWRPSPIDARGILFRARIPGEELLPGNDVTNGWGGLFAQGLEMVQASGDHVSMVIGENLEALARHINAVLDRHNGGLRSFDGERDVGGLLSDRTMTRVG